MNDSRLVRIPNCDKITVAGLGGVGKGKTIELLARYLGFKAISTGGLFRKLALDRGVSLEGLEAIAREDLSIDRELDRRMIAFGENEYDFIIDGRLAHRNIPDALKVLLVCDEDERIRRIAERDKISFVEAASFERSREASILERFKMLYGIGSMNELFPQEILPAQGGFHIIIDTTDLSVREVVGMVSDIRQQFFNR